MVKRKFVFKSDTKTDFYKRAERDGRTHIIVPIATGKYTASFVYVGQLNSKDANKKVRQFAQTNRAELKDTPLAVYWLFDKNYDTNTGKFVHGTKVLAE